MKKFILSAMALTVMATPMLAAPAAAQMRHTETTVHQGPGGRTVVDKRTVTRGPQYRNDWRKGERFDRNRAQNYRVVDYRKYRGLRAPPRGYRYVQSGNDAVLVGITSGLIAAVVAGAIR